MPYVYLVQPCELLDTNRYKIGMSSKNDKTRLSAYRLGAKHLIIYDTFDYKKLEKMLIYKFNQNFKLIAGNEYFQGDEVDMINTFNETIQEFETGLKSTKWMNKYRFKKI